MKFLFKVFHFLLLFSSLSTLVCCALPALLVSLGLGAVLAGLAADVPALVWISENKSWVFTVAGVLLLGNGLWLWSQRNAPCPLDPKLREACISGRRYAQIVYILSLGIFALGFFFAFIAARIF